MVKEVNNRLGVKSIDALIKHPFFKVIDFENLRTTAPPPFEAGMAPVKVENFPFPELLNEGEKVLMVRSVWKRKGLSTTKRDLIYTDGPRLFYTVTKTNNIKGEIPLTKQTSYFVKSDSQFIVRVPGRDYNLEDCMGEPQVWIDIFNSTSHKWQK